MFLLRSAFWLVLAFVVMKPGFDVRDTAETLSSEAMARGSQFITAQIDAIECDSINCLGGKAIASAVLQSSPLAGDPMHSLPAKDPVPLPRPRPDRVG